MTIAEKIDYPDGYTVEIHYDEDAGNPFKEFDSSPTLVLHENAERTFGWTTDEDWATRLQAALDVIAERGFTRSMYGERGALAVVNRWMRAFSGIRVVLPVGAMSHSGYTAYLGSGEHWCDPGGWDSGWVGWLFATREQITEWGFDDRPDAELEASLTSSFTEFAAYVAGETYGYVVNGPDGEEIVDGSCWGFYGSECMDTDGYMREQFEHAIDYDRTERAREAAEVAAQLASDESEIAEMALAETGGRV